MAVGLLTEIKYFVELLMKLGLLLVKWFGCLVFDRQALRATSSLIPVFGLQFLFVIYKPREWPPYEIIISFFTSTQVGLKEIIHLHSPLQLIYLGLIMDLLFNYYNSTKNGVKKSHFSYFTAAFTIYSNISRDSVWHFCSASQRKR